MPISERFLKDPQLRGDAKGRIRRKRPRVPTRMNKVKEAREPKPEILEPEDGGTGNGGANLDQAGTMIRAGVRESREGGVGVGGGPMRGRKAPIEKNQDGVALPVSPGIPPILKVDVLKAMGTNDVVEGVHEIIVETPPILVMRETVKIEVSNKQPIRRGTATEDAAEEPTVAGAEEAEALSESLERTELDTEPEHLSEGPGRSLLRGLQRGPREDFEEASEEGFEKTLERAQRGPRSLALEGARSGPEAFGSGGVSEVYGFLGCAGYYRKFIKDYNLIATPLTSLRKDNFVWTEAAICASVQSEDVSLKITHCGICYADVAWTRNMLNNSMYPLVPGHEITGVVTKVGADVKGFKVGDHVGVGTYVDSCRECENCKSSLENHCSKFVFTFNGVDTDGTVTKGGYSSHIVVHERYCFKIPDGYPLAKAAPLLCAGITVYTPMMRHNMNQPGKSLGVIGLGGLGHMAVKFGKAFGLKVTVFSTSESKREEAINLLGADNFVISSDENQMESQKSSLHFIIDTSSGDHQFDPYLLLLKVGGVMVVLSFPSEIKVHPANLNLAARSISGSITGGTKTTQEMLNFCAANKIYPDIEMIKIDYVNEALQRLVDRDVRFRFVIDIDNSF
ncbi:hypothetical protein GUJ93_ZPchr0012g19100 [Zizania palustris]|uniref:cinnamyl-alcohol dehydrogenase n=1 Tax=Zizania palustris TaxID=103762 RepID=A0A8J6BTX2_ZIZPA|nr:hypothetical protein GUJ93_ZPchr0012g19100 [Zizania palustris]